jgi:hypothetical protein
MSSEEIVAEYSSYMELLMFVSSNFAVHVYRPEDSVGFCSTILICDQHGEVHRWSGEIPPGEINMMQSIGHHMDTFNHDGWGSEKKFRTPLENRTTNA